MWCIFISHTLIGQISVIVLINWRYTCRITSFIYLSSINRICFNRIHKAGSTAGNIWCLYKHILYLNKLNCFDNEQIFMEAVSTTEQKIKRGKCDFLSHSSDFFLSKMYKSITSYKVQFWGETDRLLSYNCVYFLQFCDFISRNSDKKGLP